MKGKSITAVILLGLGALIGILIVQFLWVQSTIEIQENDIKIQNKEDSLNKQEFNFKTTQALRNVANDINQEYLDTVNFYGAVKKIKINQYTVDIPEKVEFYYLIEKLKKAFYSQGIEENYIVGIYDCFQDSIYISSSFQFDKKRGEYIENLEEENFNKSFVVHRDGHYFTVFFPSLKSSKLKPTEFISPWIYILAIVVFVLVFFMYSLLIIIRQKRLSEVKNDFINNMTHELKTPISTISISSESLLRNSGLDEETVQKYASIIYKENKRLEYQVERVLNVAKLDREKIILEKEKFDFHEAFNDAKENFELNNEGNNAFLNLELKAQKSVLLVDSVHFTNVIFNLIDNASKYSKNTPDITIKSMSNSSSFIFSICDKGIGMRRDHMQLIFDKFYRIPTGNVHDVKGFGLGLFYVKLIVEAHKGKIEVQSELEKGTTFTISIPL